MREREVRFKINEKIRNEIINSSKLVEDKSKYVDLCFGQYGFASLDILGYIIRLRNKNGKCVLESKKRISDTEWQEVCLPIENMKKGAEFLSNLSLKPYLYINRTREVRKINEAKVFIDDVELLGTFVEFEFEDSFSLEDIKYYLEKVGIFSLPEKLYGDIFKESINNPEFKNKFYKSLNDFLMKN